jgi:hypothetical protein
VIPEYWKEFVRTNEVCGADFEIDEGSDLTGLGGDLKIMTNDQCINEATNCFPGILAIKIRFLPVAMCMSGSGDYYYINSNDGRSGPLYRIYHDSVKGEELSENGIEKVLENYETLLSNQRP